MKRIFVFMNILVLSLIISCSNAKEELIKTQAELKESKEREKVCNEVKEELNRKIAALNREIERYQETPEGLYESILIILDKEPTKESIEELGEKFRRFLDKYPEHPRLNDLKDRYISYATNFFAKAVKENIYDRSQFESTANTVELMIKLCPTCKSIAATRKLLGEMRETLNNWPVEIGSLREMKLKYSDLKGKRIKIKGTIFMTPTSYYNCFFENENYWISYEVSQGSEDIYGYCKKSDEFCKKIYDYLASSGESLKASEIIFQYPRYNPVCKEDQAIIIDVK